MKTERTHFRESTICTFRELNMAGFPFLGEMKLYTEVDFPKAKKLIEYDSKLIFMGSCFAEEIGRWMEAIKFYSLINPYGITYNPISLAQQVQANSERINLDLKDVAQQAGLFFHPQFHSSLNRSTLEEFAENARLQQKKLADGLKTADFLFLTFGSAIAFEWKKTGRIVNNCHRLPATDFVQIMLDEDKMFSEWTTVIDNLLKVNRTVEIILTVSPIRHLRHGAVQNQRSKARLLKLCEKIEAAFANCTYLPVYELVMDEMRDYRFYRQDDLIHLNRGGLEMVKERFKECKIDSGSYQLMDKIEKWRKAKSHRVGNKESHTANQFTAHLKELTETLNSELPGRFSNELAVLNSSKTDPRT